MWLETMPFLVREMLEKGNTTSLDRVSWSKPSSPEDYSSVLQTFDANSSII